MELELRGKRVLVTGSSRGIGLEIARTFAQEGARVCLTGRGKSDLDQASKLLQPSSSDAVLTAICDFTVEADIKKLSDLIQSRWSGLDILVCNVGSGTSVPAAAPPRAELDRVMQINFFSCTNAVEAFLEPLKQSKGNIVVISSIAGLEAIGAPAGYAAAKSALNAYVKTLAKKYPETKVRANILAPGNVLFEGGSWSKKLKDNHDGVMKTIESTVPMQRFAMPTEIAQVACFLASSCASFVNGSVVVADGGQTANMV